MSIVTPKIRVKVSWNGRELHVSVRRGLKAPLARIAGRARIIARRQLKSQPARSARKNPSKPGESPHTIFNRNKGGHRMRMILYAERRPLEWVVGTRILGTQSKPTPSVHEHGGIKTVVKKTILKTGRATTKAQRQAYREKVRSGALTVDYKKLAKQIRIRTTRKRAIFPKRPFMNPALKKIIPQIPQMFRNTVK